MSIHEQTSSFKDQFDPPLVHLDFFKRARCASCGARLMQLAALVPIGTSTDEIRVIPLCADCSNQARKIRPTGDDLERTLDVWNSVALYLRLEDAARANKAVRK